MEADEIRRTSSLLFGHTYRLELMAALAGVGEQGLVVSEFAERQGVSASVFYPPLKALAALGLVRRSERERLTRHVPYVRSEKAAWRSLSALVKDLGVPGLDEPDLDGSGA
jgi:DNA-binding IclR family transcriptional regulator